MTYKDYDITCLLTIEEAWDIDDHGNITVHLQELDGDTQEYVIRDRDTGVIAEVKDTYGDAKRYIDHMVGAEAA